jgi:hypothetical protein
MDSNKTIKCEICGAEFDSFDSLKEHVRIETEDKKHKDHQGYDAY